MGSPGKRRGRRTRSDEPGGRTDITGGFAWPVFRHVSFSPEGARERWLAFRQARRELSWREQGDRARLAFRLALPLMLAFLGVTLLLRLGPFVLALVAVLVVAKFVRR